MTTTRLYRCTRHHWSSDAPCPECRSEDEQVSIQLDMTALGCVNVALELARIDLTDEPLTPKLVARYAYDLAAAMLEERTTVQRKLLLAKFKELG